jgi:hypothetical protein
MPLLYCVASSQAYLNYHSEPSSLNKNEFYVQYDYPE